MTEGATATVSFSPEFAARIGLIGRTPGADGQITITEEEWKELAWMRRPAAKRTEPGDNSKRPPGTAGIAAEHLRQFIARIEKLEEEKKVIAEDIKEVYAEAKGNGFDTRIIRQIIRLRKIEEADRQEAEALLDLYKQALGMI